MTFVNMSTTVLLILICIGLLAGIGCSTYWGEETFLHSSAKAKVYYIQPQYGKRTLRVSFQKMNGEVIAVSEIPEIPFKVKGYRKKAFDGKNLVLVLEDRDERELGELTIPKEGKAQIKWKSGRGRSDN